MMSETIRARVYAALLIVVAVAAVVVWAAGGAHAATGVERGTEPPPTTEPERSTTTSPGAGPVPSTTLSPTTTTTLATTTTSGATTTTLFPTTTTTTTVAITTTTTTTTTIPSTTIPRTPPPPPGTPTTTTTTTTLPDGPRPTGDEAQFLDLINGVRAQAGVPPVEFSEQLAEHARMWAAHLADTLFVEHSDLSPLVGPPWRYLGENIGFGPSPEWIVDWLTNSPTHYHTMTNPDFTHVGIGSYFDYRSVVWSVHVFGAAGTAERPIRPR